MGRRDAAGCAGQMGVEPSKTPFSTVAVVVEHMRSAKGGTVGPCWAPVRPPRGHLGPRMSFWTARHEDPRPGRKRPGAKLLVKGNLEALLTLTGKVTTGGSPGGICTLVTMEMPPQEYRLQGRYHLPGGSVDELRRAAIGA